MVKVGQFWIDLSELRCVLPIGVLSFRDGSVLEVPTDYAAMLIAYLEKLAAAPAATA